MFVMLWKTHKTHESYTGFSVENPYDNIRLFSVCDYLKLLPEGKLKGEAATWSSKYYIRPLKNRSVGWFSSHIGKWGDYYIQNNELIVRLQCKQIKFSLLINDEDIVMECMSWLRSQKPSKITGQHFKQFIEEVIIPNEPSYSKSTIAHSTSCKWLNYLSFEVTDTNKKKGYIFVDGHERADVVDYRERLCKIWFDRYLPRMESYK